LFFTIVAEQERLEIEQLAVKELFVLLEVQLFEQLVDAAGRRGCVLLSQKRNKWVGLGGGVQTEPQYLAEARCLCRSAATTLERKK